MRGIALLVLALVTLGVAATALGQAPRARIACDGNSPPDCSESGNISLGAGGYGSQSTDAVPAKAKTGTESVQPVAGVPESEFDELWTGVVAGYPALAGIKNRLIRRVLTCAVLAKEFLPPYEAPELMSDSYSSTDVVGEFLSICVQAVVTEQTAAKAAPTHAATRAAASGCGEELLSVPIEVERSGGVYTTQVDAAAVKATGKPMITVSCRGAGNGFKIGLRPRARRSSLAQVLGPHMGLGFANGASAPLGVHTTFSFK
jgi:hypothetical protein